MATFEKDILYPGVVHPPSLDRPVKFSPDDSADGMTKDGGISVPFLGRRLQDMLAAGLQIPFAAEHQDVGPLTAAEWAERQAQLTKLTLGHVIDGRLTPEGFLTATVDVPAEADARRLPSIRFASPEINWNYQDGTGKVWPGPSILHLAATPRPVQAKQRPFQPVPLSLVRQGKHGIRLSLSDYRRIRMSDSEEEAEAAEEPEEEKIEEEEEDIEHEEEDVDMKLNEILKCLKEMNVELGTGVNEDNFIHRLHPAIKTHLAHRKSGTAQGDPMAEREHEAQLPAGVALSMAEKFAKLERKDLQHRIERLGATGRISVAMADKLLTELKAVKLSMDASGAWTGLGTLPTRIEAYEALDPDTAWPASETGGIHLSGGEREAPLPRSMRDVTAQEAGDAVKQFGQMTGSWK